MSRSAGAGVGVQWCVEGGNLVAKHNYRQTRAGWQPGQPARVRQKNRITQVSREAANTWYISENTASYRVITGSNMPNKATFNRHFWEISFCYSVLTNSLPVIWSNESSQMGLLPWFLLATINDNYHRFYRFRKKPIDFKFPFFSLHQQAENQGRSECSVLSCSISRETE